MSSIVTAIDVAFEFPNGRQLFTNLNFSIGKSIIGLIGPNGVGKSTLAQLILGNLQPQHGRVLRSVSVGFLAQMQIAPSITVDEFLGADSEWSQLKDQLIGRIHRQSLCSQLSGGEWMRVRLSKVIDHGYLILDEPTNNLDRIGRDVLIDFIKNFDSGVLLISHDRECLNLCEEIYELSNKGLSKYGGNWEFYKSARDVERNHLAKNLFEAEKNRDHAKKQRIIELDKQEKRNRRGIKAAERGGLPKILIGGRKRRAQVTSGKIDVKTITKATQAVTEAHLALQEIKLDPLMYAELKGEKIPHRKIVAEAIDFNIYFDRWIFASDLNFSWPGNIRLALKGKNGSGKTSLLKALLGKQTAEHRGQINSGDLRTMYIDQNCSSLKSELSVLETIRLSCGGIESEIRNNLAKFLFEKDSVFQKVETLSGGERLRLALAQGLLQNEKPQLLLLDEPTNSLDLTNIDFLEKMVQNFEGAVIIISHDDVFLKNCKIESELEIIGS